MVALIIIGIIVAIIVLIMLIPIGADIAYMSGEFSASAKVCGILIKLFPRPPKDENAPPKEKKPKKPKKPKKEKKASEDGAEKPKKKFKLSFNKDEIFGLVKKVLKGLGKFRKMKVDRFLLHYTAAGKDPYTTANTFGYVNAALSALAPICKKRFDCKDVDVWTDVDFTVEDMGIDFGLAISIRIGQIFAVLNTILFGAVGILIKNKIRLAVEKIKNKKTGEDTESEASKEITEENAENIKADERKE